jgi:two-component system, LytTR family, response regulator
MNSVNPLRVVAVDDHPGVLRDIEALISQMEQFILVGSCSSVQEALVLIPATRPDLLLLDINLEDGTGFDILSRIPQKNIKVIFLTAYEEHAVQAFKVGAANYLMKPIDDAEFKNALNKVLELHNSYSRVNLNIKYQYQKDTSPPDIPLSSQEGITVIDLKDIVYCHSHGAYTTFFLTNNRKILTSKLIKEYEELLPPAQFIRAHKSYIVNRTHIQMFRREGELLLRNGVVIPVSFRKREHVKSFLNRKI